MPNCDPSLKRLGATVGLRSDLIMNVQSPAKIGRFTNQPCKSGFFHAQRSKSAIAPTVALTAPPNDFNQIQDRGSPSRQSETATEASGTTISALT